ncbi:12018_t:CDS:10 [Diversispora eburnea]|uniref:12018_t:CDS:1 n=1 Tax=Diversispora eburnea TaxID=1213867 RepID=A0A9N9BS93_9GLOM|nr:12018_t:CDS:10 [Diversispora eburnea]
MDSVNLSSPVSELSRSSTPSLSVFNQSNSPKDFVTRVLSPKIAVISSQDADQVCQVNNFPDFLTLIKPFGERIEGRVTAMDSQGLKIPIENFTVRFANLTSLQQPDFQMISQILTEKVKSIGSKTQELPNITTKADVKERYLEANLDDLTPWYAEYRRLFFTFTGVSEHETFEHPVACIIAISSSNKDPINTLSQMYGVTIPSPIFDKGFMDTTILKYYVLLHDNHKVSLEHSEAVFEKMKRSFGLHCHLLKLNSIPPVLIPEEPSSKYLVDRSFISDIWTSTVNDLNLLNSMLVASPSIQSTSPEVHSRQNSLTSLSSYSLPPTMSTLNSSISSFTEDNNNNDSQISLNLGLMNNSPPMYGQYLSEEDITRINSFVRELVVQSIVPFMERSIQNWNEQVASSRRGITGRLFSASRRYFSGPKTGLVQQSSQYPYASNTSSNNTIYNCNTPEAQMRKLADWSFMLRDYKFAHSVYDTVKKDFSADKAWKYYAGAQAMNAYYNRSKLPFYATRATILHYELLKFRNLYKDAPPALIRLTGDDSDLRSALFLEQAAHAFLRCSKPMVRKYAFHMILAGHRYVKCNQREHAYRCYLAASQVFENNSWSLVEDHINFVLGRQSYHLGDLPTAIKFFLKLLKASRQSQTQQSAYLKEFLYIYKQYLSKMDVEPNFNSEELPIPIIEDSSVKVILSNLQSCEYDDGWEILEEDFLDEGFSGLDAFGKPRIRPSTLSSDIHRTVCAIGEPFFVQFMIQNPMQIPININDMTLEYEFVPIPKSEETFSDLNNSSNSKIDATNNFEFQLLKFEEFDIETLPEISLEGSEKKMQGTIKVLGLKYVLNSLIRGIKKFEKCGKRLNQTREQLTNVVYAQDRSLELTVTSPMPLLEVAFHSFPEMLLSGEVSQVFLEINNKGQRGLTDLRVKMSHPSFFCIGNADMLEQKAYGNDSVEEKEPITEKFSTKNKIYNSSIKDISLPLQEDAKQSLAPGKTTLIPIWIRGDRIGKHMFRFLFTYVSEKNDSAMRFRSLRYSKTIQVLPSLKINAFTRPSTCGLNEFILGIEIENLQTSAEFQVAQLSSISPSWTISPVKEISSETKPKFLIAPRQTTFTYYRIKKYNLADSINNENESNEDKNVSPEEFTSNALDKLLTGENKSQAEPSPIDLIVTNIPFTDYIIKHSKNPLEGFSLNSRVQWRTNTLINNFPIISPNKHPSIFTLYNTNDVDLALYWNIPTLSRQGHHYIIGINLGVQQNPFQSKIMKSTNRALFEQTVRERAALANSLLKNKNFKDESPLKLVIQCDDYFEHDFQNQRFCVVNVKISIKNCSWNKRIGFTLELLSSENEPGKSSLHKSTYPTVFHWTGSTYKYAILSTEEVQTYLFKACFIRPGVYEINRWRLAVNFDPEIQKDDGALKGHRLAALG